MITEDKVRVIHSIEQLLSFMRDELDWLLPPQSSLEEVTFDWTGTELKLSDDISLRLQDGVVRQLRPLQDGQPWGVFLVDFAGPRVYATALRQVLRRLVPARRTSRPDMPAWQCENILFICTTEDQRFTFAHFCGDKPERAKLTTFSWEPQEPIRTICEFNLPPLRYDSDWDNETWLREWQSAFDVEKVTREFYREYRRVFEHVEALIEGFDNSESKRLFTQQLFNRLMFITFVQKKGWLKFDSQTNYLPAIWNAYSSESDSNTNFYRDRLRLLFFTGLNTPNDVNIVDINRNGVLQKLIGDVPYLNGGLFEEDDDDRNPDIFIPDECIEAILNDLFNRFNFTVTESTPLDIEVAVDPEMLGKVFEELVTGRNEKGSYYTPKTVVSFMCREAIKGYLGGYEELVDEHDTGSISISEARQLLRKLSQITVCDPACGSGAYLVVMLHELHELYRLLDTRAEEVTARDNYQRKLAIIRNNLYGVDIDSFAVNIAQLRLWLSLAVEYRGDRPEPLPNLDFKIEVEDSLTAPDPQVGVKPGFRVELIKQYKEKKDAYLQPHSLGEAHTLLQEISQLRQLIADWTHPGVEVEGFDWAVEFAEVFANGGFDVTIANPPYGIKCDDPLRFHYFPRQKNEDPQSKDSYGLFIARALQLLKPGGFFTFIISDTWRTIRSHRPLRAKLVQDTTVLHVLDLPSWIFEATVNTCILSLRKQLPLDEHNLIAVDLRNLSAGDWTALEANLAAVAMQIPDVQTTTYARYTYPQSLISSNDNSSFFIGSPKLYRVLSDESFVRLDDLADIKQGLATADNKYYLRKSADAHGSYDTVDSSELLTEHETSNLTESEKRNGIDPAKYGGRHLVRYDKGGESDADAGWLPNYYVPTRYFIDWSKKAVQRLRTATIADGKRRKGETHRIRASDETTRAAVIRNPEYYFTEGVTFSRTGFYAPTFRLGSSSVFDSDGSSIFQDTLPTLALLAILTSMLSRYFIKIMIDHTVHAQTEDVKKLNMPNDPVPQSIEQLEDLVNNIIQQQKSNQRYPYWLHEQKQIDALVYQLYGLSEEDIREVELWYCRRYPKLAEAQGVLAEVQQKYASHLTRCELILSRPPSYWKSHPTLQLIAQGEGQALEFKETLEADVRSGEKYPSVLSSALKTIAAFLNTDGGTLLVGVSDSGEIKGLAKDFRLCSKHDADGLEQKLRSLLRDRFKPDPLGKVNIQFEHVPDGVVCRIDIQPSHDVVYLDGKDVYVRDGNTSRKLEGPALVNWIRRRNGA